MANNTTTINVTINNNAEAQKAIAIMADMVMQYDALTLSDGEEYEKLSAIRANLQTTFEEAAATFGLTCGTDTCCDLKLSLYDDEFTRIEGDAVQAVKEFIATSYADYVKNETLFQLSEIGKLVAQYPEHADKFGYLGWSEVSADDIEIINNKIGVHYWESGAPAFFILDTQTGEVHYYNREYDDVEYSDAINNFKNTPVITENNNPNEKEGAIMTTNENINGTEDIMCQTCSKCGSEICKTCMEGDVSYWEPKEEVEQVIPEVITNITENKEEVIMKKEDLATRTLNMNRNERLVYVWDIVLHVNKTSNDLYITKGELAKFLFDNDIIQRNLSKKEIKKTNRQELVDILDTAVQNLMKAGVIIPVNTVSVGDLDITHDNAPTNNTVANETPNDNHNATIRSIIATCCNVQWNNKKQIAKNYISDFMLESCINRALHNKWSKVLKDGTKEYVDTTFTESQKVDTQEMKKRLLAGPYFIPHAGGKGYIISAEYMAWFYETQLHKNIVYRFTFKDKSKGYVDYKIDRTNKVIINLNNKNETPFDGNTWATINKTMNFNRVEDMSTTIKRAVADRNFFAEYKELMTSGPRYTPEEFAAKATSLYNDFMDSLKDENGNYKNDACQVAYMPLILNLYQVATQYK